MFWEKLHSKEDKVACSENEDENLLQEEISLQKKRLFDTPLHKPDRKEIDLPSDEDGLGWACGLKHRRWAFNHFDKFEDRIHILHKEGEEYDIGPWRLEQLSDPFLTMFGYDSGPVIGLRFKIYYNSEPIGALEIQPSREPSVEDGEVGFDYESSLSVKISSAPFLPYAHLSDFLLACSHDLFPLEGFKNRNTFVVSALTAVMWEAHRQNDMWVDLYFGFSGFVKHFGARIDKSTTDNKQV